MKHRTLLAIVTILALVTLSCSLTDGLIGKESPEAMQPPAAPGGEQPTSPPAPPPEATAPPAEEKLATRPADGMVMIYIPASEFVMGDDTSPFAPEKPQHIVYLGEYWMDRTEVSNAQYRRCVEAEACVAPKSWDDPNLNGDDQPALVLWEAAQAYCAWVGGRLPSEAEWEKAGRGTDGRKWPWGNEFEPGRANLSGEEDGYMSTAPVGTFPNGVSPYGLLDMAGNAAEWVADWYDPEYYAHSPAENPTGPGSGEQKMIRGAIANAGGGPEKCRCVARYPQDPIRWEFGFRCAATTPPSGEAAPPSSAEATPTPQPEAKPTPAPTESPAAIPTPTPPPAAEAGWKTYRVGETCSISIPEDWGGDVEALMWWPGTADLGLGRPDVSVLCGGTPFLTGESFEDRLQSYLGTEPISKERVNVSGLSGFKCVWESGGMTIHKHMGVFLEQTIGGGVGMILFADCQAPISVYDDYAATFDKIVNSFRCQE